MIYPHKPTQCRAEQSSFFTPNRHGYNVKFSPFEANCLAVATSQHFGFVGGGTLFVLQLNEDGSVNEKNSFEWSDGLFDIAWSNHMANMLITACGDGGIQLWDIASNVRPSTFSTYSKPKSCYREHSKEVCCVDWSHLSQNPWILSSSWDCSIKLWNPDYTASLSTFNSHSKLVYASKFAKKIPKIFASVSADGCMKIWDISLPHPISTISAHHESEVLSCDWSEHDQNIIATGGSDGLIRGWDLRNASSPLFELYGCEFAVRRVQFSPFDSNILASVSYDHATRIWNWQSDCEAIETIVHHSEFNYGLDWNRLVSNQLADCGWDSLVNIFSPKSLN